MHKPLAEHIKNIYEIQQYHMQPLHIIVTGHQDLQASLKAKAYQSTLKKT